MSRADASARDLQDHAADDIEGQVDGSGQHLEDFTPFSIRPSTVLQSLHERHDIIHQSASRDVCLQILHGETGVESRPP